MRNHGWELPYHPLQTVAVALFSGISLSFYVFFVPFVGSSVLKFHIYAIFSPVVLAVFVLYMRCAGCDPADPGVHQSKRAARAKLSLPNHNTPLEHSQDESQRTSTTLALTLKEAAAKCSSCCGRGLLSFPWACCAMDCSTKCNVEELLLYCSICKAKISRNSKHCKACDKCVHEFDHHCRWLNNCVGRRNYRTFVTLMVASLLLLIMVWSTGIGVLVRCFTQRANFEKEILHRLGSSFSRVPYIIVVLLLSLLAMVATLPLCQLFFFHLILIHKGITTYDYILATREQGMEHDTTEGDGFNSLTSSPASSNSTGISGYSSAGALALRSGVFCTPPRMFVEHQQQVLAFSGDLESTPSAAKTATTTTKSVTKQAQKKVSVGINPWKLARLNATEAVKVAAQVKEASTIIRPITGSSQTEDSSVESSRDVSGEITTITTGKLRKHELVCLTEKEKWMLMKDKSIPIMLSFPLEARNGFRCSPSRFSGEMRISSSCPGSSYQSCSQRASPEILHASSFPDELPTSIEETGNLQTARSSRSSDASTGESGDENGEQMVKPTLIKSKLDTSIVTPNEKVAVFWEDGTQVNPKPRSTKSGARSSRGSTGGRTDTSSGSRAEANILKHVTKEWPELRGKLSVSPVDSNGSVPSPFYTPLQDSVQTAPTVNAATVPEARNSPLPVHAISRSASKRLKDSFSVGKKSITKLAENLGFSEASA